MKSATFHRTGDEGGFGGSNGPRSRERPREVIYIRTFLCCYLYPATQSTLGRDAFTLQSLHIETRACIHKGLNRARRKGTREPDGSA